MTRQRLYRRLEVEWLENRIVPTITLQNTFTGINYGSSGNYAPPDTQGAAGTTSYVETTNQTIAIYNKSTGTAVASPDSLQDFFYTQGKLSQADAGSTLNHPVVTWDEQIDRFIVGDQDVDNNTHVSNFDLAVSKSASPATLTSADWNFFQVKTTESGYNADYPGNLGWNHDSLVFTLNMKPTGTGSGHVQINTISISALTTNGTSLTEGTNAFQTDFSNNGLLNLRPTVMHDDTGATPGDPMWFVEEGGDNKSINVVEMSGGLTGAPSYVKTNLGVGQYYTAVPEKQPDGTYITTNTDSRIMKAAMANGLIVAAHQVSDQAGNLDEIQWYVIDTTGATPILQQQGDISGGPGTYYSYPGIDINSQGDIGVSYISSGTAAGQYMSMYITGRTQYDTAGTMETPVLAEAGKANDDGDQSMGALSGISVDSDGSFWAANEFASTAVGGSWDTAIAHFTLGTNVTTAASAATAVYSPNAQTVPLSATVTDASNSSIPINEGNVTFTVLDSKGKVVGTAKGNVQTSVTGSGGTASANFNLPPGQAAGSYTIDVSYSDSSGNFTDSSDSSSTLTISAAQVDTKASNVSAYYSPNAQTLTLSAALTDKSNNSDTIGEGAVTFKVMSGTQQIGSSVQGAVQGVVGGGATATANFTLPAGVTPGPYTIVVSYTDSAGNFTDSGDTSATLTIAAANVTTTPASVSVPYSLNAQTVTLSAKVADTSITTDTVNEGTVTFTVGTLGTYTAAVSGGTASTTFSLAAKQARGSFTIAASYSDSASPANFTDDNAANPTATLSIGAASVATTAANASATFRTISQPVALSATVANLSVPANPINEGTVTFTIEASGGGVVGTTKASVQGAAGGGGTASANFSLGAGQAAGIYTIDVSYNDTLGNYADNNANNPTATLTVGAANVTATAAAANAVFSPNAQSIPLSAQVVDTSNSNDIVNEGTVTFTISDSSGKIIGSTQATVVNGTANTNAASPPSNFNWSAGRAAGTYTIGVSYNDSAGNFTDDGKSDTSANLTVAQATVTTAANNLSNVFASSSSQTVVLSANVTDTSVPSGVVNEGIVTFTVKNGASVIGTPVQGSVVNGTAKANFNLPAAPGVGVGNYTIYVSYDDTKTGNNFIDNGLADSTGTLTIAAANVTTAAANANVVFSPNAQTVALSANVANASIPGSPVNEGTVTFTVGTLGTITAPVSGGTASKTFNLSAGQAAGSYTIGVSYSDSASPANFIDNGKSDTTGTLTIAPANVKAAANNATAYYSPNTQSVALSANVVDTSNSNDTVGEGSVKFTVTDSGGTTLGTAQGTVSGGTAKATLQNFPAGQALGTYTIAVSYTDSANNFIDNGKSDTTGTLTVAPAIVNTTANSTSVFYSPGAQTLTLSANVADASHSTDPIGEGIVTFTVSNGLTVIGTAQGNVQSAVGGGGTATVTNFNLAAGQAAGGYTITVSYSDRLGNFTDSSYTSGTLTIAPASVTTTANNATAFYSPNKQTVPLSASVVDTSNSATVGEGIVTFTVSSGATIIGTVQGTVSGGTAKANFNLPAGQALGNYTIGVSYSDSANNFTDSGDNGGTLTVKAASVKTTAANASVTYNPNAPTVALGATVADTSVSSNTVSEGTVKFTITDSGGNTVGTAQGTVGGGQASANFNPAGLNAGLYTIAVSYSDQSGNFIDGGDVSGTLTVGPANVTTTAASASTTFSTAAQTVALDASVANKSNTNNVVGEGAVTFTVINSGGAVVGSVQGAVSGGAAHADFTLPAGLSAGNYIIAVGYSDSRGNFIDTGDTNGSLVIGTAATSTQLTQASISPNYSNLTVTETLSAHVGSSTPVNQGTITFALSNQTITANVDGNGNATVTLTLPMQDLLAPQTINVNYADGAPNLTSSADSQTASWQLGNPLVPIYTTFTAQGEVVTLDLDGLLISFTNGHLTEIDFGSMHLVFSYSASGQLAQVTLDGVDLLP